MNWLSTLASVPGFESYHDWGAIIVYVVVGLVIPLLLAIIAKYKIETDSKEFKAILDKCRSFLVKTKQILTKGSKKKK